MSKKLKAKEKIELIHKIKDICKSNKECEKAVSIISEKMEEYYSIPFIKLKNTFDWIIFFLIIIPIIYRINIHDSDTAYMIIVAIVVVIIAGYSFIREYNTEVISNRILSDIRKELGMKDFVHLNMYLEHKKQYDGMFDVIERDGKQYAKDKISEKEIELPYRIKFEEGKDNAVRRYIVYTVDVSDDVGNGKSNGHFPIDIKIKYEWQ